MTTTLRITQAGASNWPDVGEIVYAPTTGTVYRLAEVGSHIHTDHTAGNYIYAEGTEESFGDGADDDVISPCVATPIYE